MNVTDYLSRVCKILYLIHFKEITGDLTVAQTRRQSSTMTIQKFSLKETKLQTKHVS